MATRNSFTVMMIGFFPFPLLMVVPMAIVSTSCDDLLDELNVLSAPDKLHPTPYAKDLREREGLPHEDYNKIESLLNYLKGLNTRQGLGFALAGVVLDKRKLANLAMGCSSALGTVILLLVKLGASYETDGSA